MRASGEVKKTESRIQAKKNNIFYEIYFEKKSAIFILQQCHSDSRTFRVDVRRVAIDLHKAGA